MHEKWTEKELKILKKNYGKMTINEVRELIPNRCYDGVRSKARRLNLTKSK